MRLRELHIRCALYVWRRVLHRVSLTRGPLSEAGRQTVSYEISEIANSVQKPWPFG